VLGEPARPDTDVEHDFALAAGVALHEQWSVFGELGAILIPDQDLDSVFLTLGTAFALRPSLVLDGAVRIGLSRDAPDFQVLFGFTNNLGNPFAGS
jgi:hypothetical protein